MTGWGDTACHALKQGSRCLLVDWRGVLRSGRGIAGQAGSWRVAGACDSWKGRRRAAGTRARRQGTGSVAGNIGTLWWDMGGGVVAVGAHGGHALLVDCDLVVPKPAELGEQLEALPALRAAADVVPDELLAGAVDVGGVHGGDTCHHELVDVLDSLPACSAVVAGAAFVAARQLPVALDDLREWRNRVRFVGASALYLPHHVGGATCSGERWPWMDTARSRPVKTRPQQ